jgi:cyclin-dependent kinase 7
MRALYISTTANVTLGREIATGKKVAIKKIKVGQFKDGLDMSAIREVKYLRELKHQNVVEVRYHLSSLKLCSLVELLCSCSMYSRPRPT